MLLKRVILWYGMICYAFLCYGMVWKVRYAMRFQWYAMKFLCYAMVFVVKDKHSATVTAQQSRWILNFHTSTQWTNLFACKQILIDSRFKMLSDGNIFWNKRHLFFSFIFYDQSESLFNFKTQYFLDKNLSYCPFKNHFSYLLFMLYGPTID